MAPKKRRASDDNESTVKKPSTELATRRVTRSLTAGLNGIKTLKVTVKPPATQPPKKKTKAKTIAKEKSEEAAENEKDSENVGGSSKTIVIEHCKQCSSFKTRAVQVKNGLEARVSGITVLLNPDKPRRGCFEIREEGGEKFVSLMEMKRPFTPMKALDMDNVIADIIEKIR